MSINVQKKDLLEAMQKAYPIVPSKSSLMILCNFRISYADSILEVLATDVDHSLRVTVGASGDGEIDIAVNAKKIFDVVRELPEGSVTVDVDGMVLLLESEKGFSCKISGSDPSDFPGIPSMDGGIGFSVDASTLRDIIRKSSLLFNLQPLCLKLLKPLLLSLYLLLRFPIAVLCRRILL